jgi:heme exporter protein B
MDLALKPEADRPGATALPRPARAASLSPGKRVHRAAASTGLRSALHAAAALAGRDLRVALRRPAELLTPLAFQALLALLFALAIGPLPETLRTLAPALLWVGALLASLLALPRLFAADLADGSLEHWLLSPHPTVLLVAAKTGAHWLQSGLPLVLMAAPLGLLFGLDGAAIGRLALALLLGTPVLALLGALGAALTLQARAAGAVLALLLLPLYVPVLIFGSGAAQAANALPHLTLLAGLLAGALALLPAATAAALRLTLD